MTRDRNSHRQRLDADRELEKLFDALKRKSASTLGLYDFYCLVSFILQKK